MNGITSKYAEDIFEFIEDIVIPEALIEISPELIEIYKDAMDKTVYARTPSKYYNRTRSAYNSLDADIDKQGLMGWMLKIFANPTKMRNKYPSQPYREPVAGSDNREMIIEWMNNRSNGGMYKGRKVKPTNNNFVDLAYKEANKKIRALLKGAFNSLGYKTYGR